MFYYVYCSTQICIFKTQLYTKTQVLLKPGLKSSVIPPNVFKMNFDVNIFYS